LNESIGRAPAGSWDNELEKTTPILNGSVNLGLSLGARLDQKKGGNANDTIPNHGSFISRLVYGVSDIRIDGEGDRKTQMYES
jgi:hypothetical protein